MEHKHLKWTINRKKCQRSLIPINIFLTFFKLILTLNIIQYVPFSISKTDQKK